LARNTDVQNLGVITTKDAAEKNDCLVVISQENAKQWVAIYILGLLQSTQGTYFQCLHVNCPLWDSVFLFWLKNMYI
jgi:hypothetical protein